MKTTGRSPRLVGLLRQLWAHIDHRRRRQYFALLALMLTSALAEVVSLGAVVPFIAVLTSPELLFKHAFVGRVVQQLGFRSPNELVLPLTAAFAAAALVAGAIRVLLLWAANRIAFATATDLNVDVYRRTLHQPYSVHVARHSSEIISGIVNHVQAVVHGVLLPLLNLASAALLLLALTATLIAIDPVIALYAGIGFGGAYVAVTWLVRKRLRRNSERIAREHTNAVKTVEEGLGAVRDVLLDGTQSLYCEFYRRADYPLHRAQANNGFLAACPRYVMEALGMVVIAGLAYSLSLEPRGIVTALPVLAALAFAAQRLLPALQHSYASWASIVGNYGSLVETIRLLEQPLPPDVGALRPPPLPLRRAIRFSGVCYRYGPEAPWVLRNINLTIPNGSRVGLVGTTGSGKSTLTDVLMGLLVPNGGELLVDDEPLTPARLRAWQRNIAHVPQNIFLADATIAENVAFGVPPDQMDLGLIEQAARQAQLAEFIEGLPNRYQTVVGERGVRLSGGQRQRIGIARALYKHAGVLIFDEATSALDSPTERSVMEAIEALYRNRELTIVIIAHRISTVRLCDVIVELKDGQVAAQGTYDQLLQASATFRSLAKPVA